MHSVTLLAGHIGRAVRTFTCDDLRMELMLEVRIPMTRFAVDRFNLLFVGHIFWIETGMTSDAKQFLMRGLLESSCVNVERYFFPFSLHRQRLVRVTHQTVFSRLGLHSQGCDQKQT